MNWETIGLLFGMFIIVVVLADSGFFSYLALILAKTLSYDPKRIFILFPLLAGLLAAFINSITVMLFLAVLTFEISKLLKIDPVPIIVGEVVLANTATAEIQTTAPRSGQVTFAWTTYLVQGSGKFEFLVDNVVVATAPGGGSDTWSDLTPPVTVAAGQHLSWRATAISQGQGNNVHADCDLDWLRFTPSVNKGTVLGEITQLHAYIDSHSVTFSNANTHKAFDNKLATVYKLVDTGTATSYAETRDKIRIDLLPKTDGVAPDWVTETTDQQYLYDQLLTLYDDIGVLPT